MQNDCYPWHQLQLPRQRQQPTEVPELGVLPRDWRWGNNFLPAILHWLRELHWLPTDDDAPVGHRQVSFMELALDFESYAGRPLPHTPPRTTTARKGPGPPAGGHPLGESGRTRIYLAGSNHDQMSLVGPAGSRHGGRGDGPAALHHTTRGMAPRAKAAPIQFGALGAPATTEGGAARAREASSVIGRQLGAAREMSGERWSQEGSRGICQ